MTQKDLLYLEDAIEHENSIIKLCNNFLNNLNSEELSLFIENQIKLHEELKNKLMLFLKESVHE